MIRIRTYIWLCLLCALGLSAITPQVASAATKGQTAFTCVSGEGALKGSHCLTTGSGSAHGHVAIAENTTTELSVTNANTASETTAASPTRLKVTIAGTPVELTATTVAGSGTLANKKEGSGEHTAEGEATIVLSGATVSKPAGKGCEIYTEPEPEKEGAAGTIKLRVKVKLIFLPLGGWRILPVPLVTVITNFMLTCKFGEVPEALQGSWAVTGSFDCPGSGATVICNHAEVTTANTLKAKGSKAGIEGAFTFSARANSGQSFTPLSLTAVETP